MRIDQPLYLLKLSSAINKTFQTKEEYFRNAKFQKPKHSLFNFNLPSSFLQEQDQEEAVMAATFWSAAMKVCSLPFILIFIIASSPLSLSQPIISPQNIQTFYPFFLPPLQPPRIPTRRRVHPPPPPPPPPPDPEPLPPPLLLPLAPSTPSKKAVGTAIGVTAASTVVLSALVFFFVLWYLRSRKEKGGAALSSAAVAGGDGGGGSYENKPAGTRDEFLRFEGNLKAVIVDEDGLDVLYWRKLEGGEGKQSFDRQLFSNIESDRKDDEKRMIGRGGGRKKPGPPVQQIPLLRGKSSTSQHPVWAEPENQEAASIPPPPPPPLSIQAIPKTPSPPPSPPKPDALASSSSSSSSEEEEKLNPLHLDNVVVDHSSMDWNKIEDGSYKFDGDLMEALFGTVATNRKSPRTDSTPASTPREISSPPSQIFILETTKSQEFAAIIKSLNATRKEIMNALHNGVGLDAESLEKLSRVSITKAEESDILGFEGPPTRLADAESFLFFILKPFPSAFHRFNAMFLRSRFGSEIIHLKADLHMLESACNELRNSRLFIKLLEAILKAWNRMNVGSSRGNGHGFKLSSLRKLSDVKSGDGTITVLQFVVQEVIRAEGKRCVYSRDHRIISNIVGGSDNDEREKEYMTLGLPVVGGLSSEFAGVKKAAGIDYDSLSAAHSALSSKASEIGNLAAQCGDDGGGFAAEMRRFLRAAEEEMEAVREEKARVMEMVKKTTEYYQRGSSNDRTWPPLQLFVIVKDFLGMIDEACVEIARNLQKRRPAGSSSSSSLPSRTVKFPKLPADFLSDGDSSSDS